MNEEAITIITVMLSDFVRSGRISTDESETVLDFLGRAADV